MRTGKKKGLVIEMMIIFMVVTFGFCLVLTTYIGTLNIERKVAKHSVDMQTDLNQIGEYYLRYIEESGKQFPKGSETTFASDDYKWMDDGAKEFFAKCKDKYGFTYEPEFSITRGTLLEFFKTKFVWRKLVVKAPDDNIKMIIELQEKRTSDTTTEYYIKTWSVGDELFDESAADGGYQEDRLTILQKLWRFVGLEINSISDLMKNGEWLQFFRSSINNFENAMNDGF